ncbi:hypothetical protein LTR70_009576 [Exophiala xenobiotica]|uniref:Acyltransferase n=1 Tax=Lithohypha guttulata TaxID=1690604 RepID=A0ABR0JXW9_9EURO|nr:hypothetical protein LTR24_009136 [Lithohypha guttulata]KAK5310310.1 hypothetical protein LTR70_009576 [Exophiala xenobiotica]
MSDSESQDFCDPDTVLNLLSSEDNSAPAVRVENSNDMRTLSYNPHEVSQTDHIVHLSSIDCCMPKAYIRVCLAYRVPSDHHLKDALSGLRQFVKNIVRAKPYLAGYVTDVKHLNQRTGRAEIRFTTNNYLNYPRVTVQNLCYEDGSTIKYDDLVEEGLPPSRLLPEEVSALPPNVDQLERAPVLGIQANCVEGGLIVSIYLHHCVSDGTGFDFLTSGDVLGDHYVFLWPLESHSTASVARLDMRLKVFAQQETSVRQRLSRAPSFVPRSRNLQARQGGEWLAQNKPGRGCVLMISAAKVIARLKIFNGSHSGRQGMRHTKNTVLKALLWRHMTRARRPSIAHDTNVKTSKLLIPVNIRGRIRDQQPPSYFGAAVDFAKAELDLDVLTSTSPVTLQRISSAVRQAILSVTDSYIREAIVFVNSAAAGTDVHDLQASNMDRVTAADMYVTSWLKLRTYHHDLGMGLGRPDWVRKPWSRDPGSCIILPRKPNTGYFEVVVQMTEDDMDQLLNDQSFMEFVDRVID